MANNTSDANSFYDRIVQGQEKQNHISLEHSSGAKLEGVRMNPVSKRVLASVIQRLPQELFDAVEDSDDYDEAEEQLESQGTSTSAITEGTVAAFEDLCKESLTHSFEKSGDIKDFHEQE